MYFYRILMNAYFVVPFISLIFAAKPSFDNDSAGKMVSTRTSIECNCKAAELCPGRYSTSIECRSSSERCCINTVNSIPNSHTVDQMEDTANPNPNYQAVNTMGKIENSTTVNSIPNSHTVDQMEGTANPKANYQAVNTTGEIKNSTPNSQTVDPVGDTKNSDANPEEMVSQGDTPNSIPTPETQNYYMEENPEKCGIRNIAATPTPPTNVETSTVAGEFPWIVLIFKTEKVQDGTLFDKLLCGGSLITSKIVLTAAHCVFKYQNNYTNTIKVRAGEFDTRPGDDEIMSYQDRAVDIISIPDNFNVSTLHNDIALIRVKRSFIYNTANVFSICVPLLQSPYAEFNIYNTTDCMATGWGKGNRFNGGYQNTLKKVQTSVFRTDECQSEFQKTNLGKRFELHSSFICAKGLKGGDTCKNGIGGPLVCKLLGNRDQYIQVGVASWNIECGNIPGVYTSLEKNQNWLISEVHNLRLL